MTDIQTDNSNSVPDQISQPAPAPAPVQQAPVQPVAPAAPAATPAPAPAAPAQTPTQAASKPGFFDKVLGTVAGHPQTHSIDANGNETATPVTSRASLAQHIVAAAIVGMLKGASTHGPGGALNAFGQGGEAGFDQAQKASDAEKQKVEQNFEQQQAAQTHAAQLAHLNLQTSMLGMQQSQLGKKAGQEAVDQGIATSKNIVDAYEAVAGPQREWTFQEMNEAAKAGKLSITDGTWFRKTALPQGPDDDGDPRAGSTWVQLDPNQQIPLTKEFAQSAISAGVPGWNAQMAANIPEGATMSVKAAQLANNQVQAVDLVGHIANKIHAALGTDADEIPDARAALAKAPGGVPAVMNFLPALQAANGDVPKALQAYQKTSPSGAATITAALGGQDVLNAYDKANAPGLDIKTVEQAVGVKTNPDSTPKQIKQANDFLSSSTAQQVDLAKKKKQGEASADAAATGSGLSGDDYLKTLPVGLQSQVKAFGEGRLLLTNLPRGKEKTAIVQALTQAYPDFDETKVKSYEAARKDFTSGKVATGINSYNTAIAHLGTMFDHVNGTNSFQLDNPFSEVHRQLELDNQLVSTELAKAVSNGQMTEGEKKDILSGISGMTTGSYKTKIQEAISLLNGKLDSYQSQWDSAKPSQAVSNVPILNQKSKATIDRIVNGNAPQAQSFSVTDPNGKVHPFDSQAQADAFKKAAGIK